MCLILENNMCLIRIKPYFLRARQRPYLEMMGLIGMGNNPMVGATVAVAVAVEEALKK